MSSFPIFLIHKSSPNGLTHRIASWSDTSGPSLKNEEGLVPSRQPIDRRKTGQVPLGAEQSYGNAGVDCGANAY